MTTSAPRGTSWIVLTVMLGAALRLTGLGRESFWHDESWTWALIDGSPAQLLDRLLHDDNHPPLYFALIWIWSGVSDTEAWLRLFSALVGCASIVAMHSVARRACGERAGRLAALLIAISPYAVYYSQEARSYALLFLFCALALDALLALREEATPRRWMALAALQAAVMYTHYMGAFFILAELIAAPLLARGRPGFLRAFAFAGGLALLLYAPWLPVFLRHAAMVGDTFWLKPPTWSTVFHGLTELIADPDGLPRLAGVAPALLVWGTALVFVARARSAPVLALAFMVLAPIAGELLVSLRRPIFYTQTFQFVLIPLFALVASALARLPGRRAGVATAILALSFAPALVLGRLEPHKEDWRGLVRVLESRLAADEPVIVDPGYAACNIAYLLRDRGDTPLRSALVRVGSDDFHGAAVPHDSALRRVREHAPGVWLVYRYGDDAGWNDALSDLFIERESFVSRGAEAHHFVRRSER